MTKEKDIDEAAIRARAENTRIPNITSRGDISDLLSLLDAARRERDEARANLTALWPTLENARCDRDAFLAALERIVALDDVPTLCKTDEDPVSIARAAIAAVQAKKP